MQKSFKDMATRSENSRDRLIENIATAGKISKAEAATVAEYYLRNKLAKLDPIGGQPSVTHGAFYDRDVIEQALRQARPDRERTELRARSPMRAKVEQKDTVDLALFQTELF